MDVFDEEGRAALHLAAENDHLDVVDILLQHKAFVNAKNKDGVTAAHVAAERGASDIVELLVDKYQAATDVVSMSKKTPLHLGKKWFHEVHSQTITGKKISRMYFQLLKLVS